jgi:hypothetical protein
MQKVEGSNPFSRFAEKPRSGGAFLWSGREPHRCNDLLPPNFAAYSQPSPPPDNPSKAACQNDVMTKAELHQMVDRLPDQAVDGAAILLREVTDGRIDPEQAWFWTREWQEREREADKDLAAGRVTRFESDEDFLAELDERTKPLDADA